MIIEYQNFNKHNRDCSAILYDKHYGRSLTIQLKSRIYYNFNNYNMTLREIVMITIKPAITSGLHERN